MPSLDENLPPFLHERRQKDNTEKKQVCSYVK